MVKYFVEINNFFFTLSENYLWAIGGHSVDRNLIFRDRATKEFLYFDEQGVWDA